MNINIDGHFGKILRKKRTLKGFTQHELADTAKLDRTYISMLERGLRKPSLEVVINIANVLDLSGADFVLEIEELLKECKPNK